MSILLIQAVKCIWCHGRTGWAWGRRHKSLQRWGESLPREWLLITHWKEWRRRVKSIPCTWLAMTLLLNMMLWFNYFVHCLWSCKGSIIHDDNGESSSTTGISKREEAVFLSKEISSLLMVFSVDDHTDDLDICVCIEGHRLRRSDDKNGYRGS
jgi:hypothetical protein